MSRSEQAVRGRRTFSWSGRTIRLSARDETRERTRRGKWLFVCMSGASADYDFRCARLPLLLAPRSVGHYAGAAVSHGSNQHQPCRAVARSRPAHPRIQVSFVAQVLGKAAEGDPRDSLGTAWPTRAAPDGAEGDDALSRGSRRLPRGEIRVR